MEATSRFVINDPLLNVNCGFGVSEVDAGTNSTALVGQLWDRYLKFLIRPMRFRFKIKFRPLGLMLSFGEGE